MILFTINHTYIKYLIYIIIYMNENDMELSQGCNDTLGEGIGGIIMEQETNERMSYSSSYSRKRNWRDYDEEEMSEGSNEGSSEGSSEGSVGVGGGFKRLRVEGGGGRRGGTNENNGSDNEHDDGCDDSNPQGGWEEGGGGGERENVNYKGFNKMLGELRVQRERRKKEEEDMKEL